VESAGIARTSATHRLVADVSRGKAGNRRMQPTCNRAVARVAGLYSGQHRRDQGRQNQGKNEQARQLIVDDDASVRAMLREYLQGHGYAVVEASGGIQMRECIEAELPDVVLLDIRLPGEDGLTLAKYLRERYDVGIIMVTASGDVIDRVVGLELGADDYVAKPFDPRELLARLKSVLRRIQAKPAGGTDPATASQPARQRVGRCELDVEARRLFDIGGAEIAMTTMEFDLLRVFLANPNRVMSRDQLLMHTRNREWEPFDRSIDIRIGRLRRKVEPDPAGEPRCIRTVRNAGYMYVPLP
jgi:two-component system phosphate regulon response regulator OmpR